MPLFLLKYMFVFILCLFVLLWCLFVLLWYLFVCFVYASIFIEIYVCFILCLFVLLWYSICFVFCVLFVCCYNNGNGTNGLDHRLQFSDACLQFGNACFEQLVRILHREIGVYRPGNLRVCAKGKCHIVF